MTIWIRNLYIHYKYFFIKQPLKTILVKKSQEEKKYSLARFCKNIEQYKIQK